MRQYSQVIGICTVAMLLVACNPAGNLGSGGLPGQGDYTSNKPSSATVPCVNEKTKQTVNTSFVLGASGIGNCDTVPDPYGVVPPKDLTPKITFPEYSESVPEILVVPGNASSVFVSTDNVATLTVACAPVAPVSLTSNTGSPDTYLLYLGGMSSADITCTLSGSGDTGNVSVMLTFKPAPSNYVEKLEIRNLPTQIPIEKAGESFSFNNFYVRGYEKPTSVKVECTSGQKPNLVDVAGKLGWYSMVVSGPDNVGLSESCTVSAVRTSDGQVAAATVVLSTPDITFIPSITSKNFKAGDPLLMIPLEQNTANYAALIGDYKDQPFPKITVHSLDSVPTLTISCTDANAAGFVPSCDAAPTCSKDPAFLQCEAPCGVPGEVGYLVCVNNCFDTIYNPCLQKTCPVTNFPSKMTSLGKLPTPANPADTYEFELFINYNGIGTANSVDTCTITAVNESGGKVSYPVKVQHVIPILKPQANIVKTGDAVFSDYFSVFPYDSNTSVKLICAADANALLKQSFTSDNPPKPLGHFYIKTIAPSKIGDSNVCTVTVAHGNNAPATYRTLTVTATQ